MSKQTAMPSNRITLKQAQRMLAKSGRPRTHVVETQPAYRRQTKEAFERVFTSKSFLGSDEKSKRALVKMTLRNLDTELIDKDDVDSLLALYNINASVESSSDRKGFRTRGNTLSFPATQSQEEDEQEPQQQAPDPNQGSAGFEGFDADEINRAFKGILSPKNMPVRGGGPNPVEPTLPTPATAATNDDSKTKNPPTNRAPTIDPSPTEAPQVSVAEWDDELSKINESFRDMFDAIDQADILEKQHKEERHHFEEEEKHDGGEDAPVRFTDGPTNPESIATDVKKGGNSDLIYDEVLDQRMTQSIDEMFSEILETPARELPDTDSLDDWGDMFRPSTRYQPPNLQDISGYRNIERGVNIARDILDEEKYGGPEGSEASSGFDDQFPEGFEDLFDDKRPSNFREIQQARRDKKNGKRSFSAKAYQLITGKLRSRQPEEKGAQFGRGRRNQINLVRESQLNHARSINELMPTV